MNRGLVAALAIAAATLLAGLLVALDVPGPARSAVASAFLLLGPGFAIVRFLRVNDAMAGVTLAVAASLGLDAAVSTALFVTRLWSSGRAFAIIVAFTLACVVLTLVMETRAEKAIPQGPSPQRIEI